MALLVTASAGYGSIGAALGLPLGTGNAWTASVWFRPATLTPNSLARAIVGQTGTSLNTGWAIVYLNGTTVQLRVQGIANTTAWPIPASAIWDGVWITYVSTGTSVLAYANGALVQTDARTISTLNATGLGARVGWYGAANEGCPGAIAEFAWWDRALSATEVSELARGVPAEHVPWVFAYWPLRGTSTTGQRALVNRTIVAVPTFTPATGTFTRTWHPENTPPRIQPAAAPDTDLTAWVLELEHPSGTRRYASESLGLPQDVETVGAAVPAGIKNAQQLAVTESFTDGFGGFSSPSRVTVRVSNTEHVTVAEAMRPRGAAPVVWYKLDDSLREEINATALTPVGVGAFYVDGPAGGGDQAATFTGTTPTSFHITAPGQPEHNLASAWMLSFWVKRPNTTQASRYVMNRGNNWAVLYGYTTNALEFYASGYSGSDPRTGTAITLPADTWTHIAYVRNGTSWVGYVNGQVAWSHTRTFSLAQPTANLPTIFFGGASSTTNRWLGSLFDVAIHHVAPTADEVRRIYEAGLGRIGLSPTVRYAGTPAYLRRYDRTSGVYQTIIAGTVADQRSSPGEMQLTLSSFDESILATKLPAKSVTVGNFPSGRDQSAAIPVVYGQAYMTPPHVGRFQDSNDYAIGFKPAGIIDIFADSRGGTGALQKVSEWSSFDGNTISLLSTTKFSVPGDWTAELPPGTTLRFVKFPAGAEAQTRVIFTQYINGQTEVTTDASGDPLDISIGTWAADEIEIVQAGTGYQIGDRIRFGLYVDAQYEPSYIVTGVGLNGAVTSVQQIFRPVINAPVLSIDPEDDYLPTTTTGSGTGLTVWPATVSANLQYLTAIIETGRYSVDNQNITSVRFNGDAPGTVVLRVTNNPGTTLLWDSSAVLADILGNPTYGLSQPIAGSDFDVNTDVNIQYVLGGNRIQRGAGDLLRDLCMVRGCRLWWDPRSRVWRYKVDTAPNNTIETFGFADGEYNNIKNVPTMDTLSDRQAVKDLVLRYGRMGRVKSQGDVTSYLAENEYPFEIRRRVSNYGSDKILTGEHLGGFVAASRALKYQAAIARGYRRSLRINVGLLGHRVSVGDLVRVRVPSLGVEEVMRVAERTVRLGDAELGLIQHLPEAYAPAVRDDFGFVDVYASKFVEEDIFTENGITEAYGEGSNLALNPDFALPLAPVGGVAQKLPGWVIQLGNADTAPVDNMRRPEVPNSSPPILRPSSDFLGGSGLHLTANPNASLSIYPSVSFSVSGSSADNSSVVRFGSSSAPFIVSVYASSPIGWYFGIDQGLSLEIAPSSVSSDKNPIGWRRYYAILRPTRTSNFRVRIVLRPINAGGVVDGIGFDAFQLERGTSSRLYPTPWKRNPSSRIDPAVLGHGQLRVMSALGLGTATAVEQKVVEVNTTSGNSITIANEIPAGSFLLGVTSQVLSTVTTAASGTLAVGLSTTGNGSLFGSRSGSSFPTGELFQSADFIGFAPQYYLTAPTLRVSTSSTFTGGRIRLIAHMVRLLGGQT